MSSGSRVVLLTIEEDQETKAIAVAGADGDQSCFEWVGGSRAEAFAHPAAVVSEQQSTVLRSRWTETDEVSVLPVPVECGVPLENVIQKLVTELEASRSLDSNLER